MRKVTHWKEVEKSDRGAVAAIGNFDGVHLGHRSVLDIARAQATSRNAPLAVMTFEPHPRQFFAPSAPAFRLMNAEARSHRLERLGVDILYELPFGPEIAGLTPEAFAQEVLAEGIGANQVVVGADFHFGKARAGNTAMLVELGKKFGFDVCIADLLGGEHGEISSTAIRQALSDGRPGDAAKMLGHWHRIEGEVMQGDQRGRDLGYPTANMSIVDLHPPKFGIYAVKIDVLTGPHAGSYDGAASIGVRPTFGENTPNLESFLFDFSGDLYHEHLSVALVEYLRPELKFDDLDQLVAQMDKDCARAREILAAL